MKCSIIGCNKEATLKFYPNDNESVFCSKTHSHLWFNQLLFKIDKEGNRK